MPTPGPTFVGKVQMDLGVLSRVRMDNGVREQLALLDEPWIRQAFNLKRAYMTIEVPVEGHDLPLAVLNTHLSAFSYGDGTLEKQVAALRAWIDARPAGQPWIVAGDLNLLPSDDDPARLGRDASYYDSDSKAIGMLQDQFEEVAGTARLAPEQRTYVPPKAQATDRKIDWMFYGGPLVLREARVGQEYVHLSDHMPMRAVFVVGEAAEEEPADPEAEAPSAEGGDAPD